MQHFTKRASIWIADESGPMIWGLIIRLRFFIALLVLAVVYYTKKELFLDWFDFNLALIQKIRQIPVIGVDAELFLRFFNIERWMVFGEISVPLLIFAWTRRRLRVRASRDQRSHWDARFWCGARDVLFGRRRTTT